MRLVGVEQGKKCLSVFERSKLGFVMSDASGQFITDQPTFSGPSLVRYLLNESGRPIVKVGGGYEEDIPPAADHMIVTDSCGRSWKWRGPTGARSLVAWDGCHLVMEPHPDFKELADYRVVGEGDCNFYDAVLVDIGGGTFQVGYRATPTRVPGEVITWMGGNTAIPGYLLCDGEYHDPATYPQLFANIGYTHGQLGDQFRVPDLRGMFLRGVDGGAGNDPNAAGRAAAAAGANSGDNVGSVQQDAFQGHKHGISISSEIGDATGADVGIVGDAAINGGQDVTVGNPTEGANGPVRTAAETRPKNVSVTYLIYAGCTIA